jgi:hypothetical protein
MKTIENMCSNIQGAGTQAEEFEVWIESPGLNHER